SEQTAIRATRAAGWPRCRADQGRQATDPGVGGTEVPVDFASPAPQGRNPGHYRGRPQGPPAIETYGRSNGGVWRPSPNEVWRPSANEHSPLITRNSPPFAGSGRVS